MTYSPAITISSFIAEIFYIPQDSSAAEPIRRLPSEKQTPAHVPALQSWAWASAAAPGISFYGWALGRSEHLLLEPACLAGRGGMAKCRDQEKKTGKGAPGSPQQYQGALTKLAAGSVSTLTDKPPMGASWCEQSDKGAFLQDGLAQAELCVNSLLLFLLSSSYVVRNGLASRCVHVT